MDCTKHIKWKSKRFEYVPTSMPHHQHSPTQWIQTHHITTLIRTPYTPNNFILQDFNNYPFLALFMLLKEF